MIFRNRQKERNIKSLRGLGGRALLIRHSPSNAFQPSVAICSRVSSAASVDGVVCAYFLVDFTRRNTRLTMWKTRLLAALRAYRAATAAGQVSLPGYISVISGTGILLFLTLDTNYTALDRIIGGIIWINIAYFVWEWVVRVRHAAQQRELRSYLLSGSGMVDGISSVRSEGP